MFVALTAAVHAGLLALLFGIPWVSAIALLAFLAYHAVVAWGVLSPRSRVFGPCRSRLDGGGKVVALTFDDGPHPEVTPRLLDLLRERGVRATFFLIGREAARHPALVRRIAAEGHALGNHTQRHSYLFWAFPPSGVRREIEEAQRTIESASGARCALFRAPVGMKSPFQREPLRRLGLECVGWETRFLDRGSDPARLRRRLSRRIRPGSVLLLHDGADRDPAGNPRVLEALPVILGTLDGLGYRCEPLS
jgi:peptidoglycan/xylan/chitin deacetylase (PgdA/CDA1 family)